MIPVRTPLKPKIAGQFRVLVTGSRTWDEKNGLWSVLDAAKWYAHKEGLELVIIHGANKPEKEEVSPGVWEYPDRSADWLTHLWCKDRRIKEERYPVQWKVKGKYNPNAAQERNAYMVSKCNPDICVRAMRGVTPGTARTAKLAKKADIPIVPIYQDA